MGLPECEQVANIMRAVAAGAALGLGGKVRAGRLGVMAVGLMEGGDGGLVSALLGVERW
jgi:hypothetical protein